jgi:VIT1/CCC1 family predicted Fe2+/Mn2+ transporter
MSYVQANDGEPTRLSSNHTNKLRAAVLGANDGIVSVAGLVVGVAGASTSRSVILAAGVAGLIAGTISMAAGEYVSVSSQRDTEQAVLEHERQLLHKYPDEEIAELAAIYEAKGLSAKTAKQVARELTDHDVFRAHADAEHGIDPNELTNPWHAAIASATAFCAGALIPLLTILVAPGSDRIPFTFVAVLVALVITGTLSARFSRSNAQRAVFRVVVGGALAMVITYGIGRLFGISTL